MRDRSSSIAAAGLRSVPLLLALCAALLAAPTRAQDGAPAAAAAAAAGARGDFVGA